MASPKITGTNLLNAATAWYRDNGAIKIPEYSKVGASSIHGSLFYDPEVYDITSQDEDGETNSIQGIPGYVIPLLAAISVGFDTQALLKITNEHGIFLEDITGMCFDHSQSTGISCHQDWSANLTPVRITIEATKAFSEDDEMYTLLRRSFPDKPSSRESLGVMHTKHSEIWPATLIEEHAKEIMTPTKGSVSSIWTPFAFTVSAPQTDDELPNNNPIELLRRSGMLSEPIIRKQTGLFDHWEDLAYTAGNDHDMQIKIMTALTKVQHKPTLDLISRGLRSISVDASQDDIDGATIYNRMHEILGKHPVLGKAIENPILQLNMVRIDDYNRYLDIMCEDQGCFDRILTNEQTLVSRVAEDILARPAEHLGYSDYCALQKLSKMSLAPQIIKFSPEKLINHVLNSLETFVTPNVVKSPHKVHLDIQVLKSVEALASVLTRYSKIDASPFQGRSEAIKVDLVRGGFDIKDFPGISRRSRGLILENDLGM